MKLGTTAALWRYPVKSLQGEALEEARIERDGIPGDRATSLIVIDGHARLNKPYRGKEDERLHRLRSAAQACRAAAERGVSLDALDARDGHDFDSAPISIIVDRWLEPLTASVGYPVEYQRFRPNLFVSASPDFAMGEPMLAGCELRSGTAILRVRAPIGRCVTTTYDPLEEHEDPAILRYIATERENMMGIYCDVVRAGTVRIGDALLLDER
ncbi:MAG: MOSC domain-containing protein [Vulcanimicrobiaceae bacterium]